MDQRFDESTVGGSTEPARDPASGSAPGLLSPDAGLPPGPREGVDIETGLHPLETMCALHREHGDIYSVYSPRRNRRAIVIVHPDHLKHVLIDNQENYRKGVGFELVKMLLGNGIIVSDGPFWRRQRRMVQPAFRRERIARYAHAFAGLSERLREDWSRKARAGERADVTAECSVYALECVLHALFSDDVAGFSDLDGGNPFMVVAEEAARDLAFAQKFRRLGKLVAGLAGARRADGAARCDILEAVMAARDAESGEPMPDARVVDEMLTLVVAGHETSAAALNWSWHLLSRHPEAEARLHDEIDAAPPDAATTHGSGYAAQVLEETMRLYPPVWRFTRRAVADDEIGGYRIPAGSDVYVCPYLTHRHPEFWDAPEAFRPERFDPESKRRRHRLAFVPFSAGPRRCIGDRMAMVEMGLHVDTVARELRLVSVSDAPVEMAPEINLRSRRNLLMNPVRRRCDGAR